MLFKNFFIILSWPILMSQAKANDFNFENLVDLVNTNNPTSVSEVIPLLPAEIRSNYTMMHTSMSAQGASPEFPRVIMFGSNGKMIITFNGSPDQRNYSRLEIMQFRDDSKQFEFRTISFANGLAISKPNPTSCLSCHGSSPHPIWANYPSWDGAFGSDDDHLGAQELGWFLNWRDKAVDHDRYKHLLLNSELSDSFPYRVKYFGNITESAHIIRPNDRLGNFFIRLNSQRIAQKIIQSDIYQKYPYTVLMHLLNCSGEQADFYKAGITNMFQAKFPIANYPEIYKQFDAYSVNYNPVHFMVERLTTGIEFGNWNLSLADTDEIYPYNAGRSPEYVTSITGWVLPRILEDLSKRDAFAREITEAWSYKNVYDSLSSFNAAQVNLVPYGVLANYDADAMTVNFPKAQSHCTQIFEKSKLELSPTRMGARK